MSVSKNLLQAIAVTAELTQTQLSETAARVMAEDLAQFDEQMVLGALVRCRRELKKQMCISDIIDRLEDGRPGANEAWAMIPKNENDSVVWTREMAEAYGVCYQLMNEGDMIAARMAFIEAYKERCADARNNAIQIKWEPSLGYDKNGREHVIMAAVEKGLLRSDHAAKLLPYHEHTDANTKLLSMIKDSKLLSKTIAQNQQNVE